MTRVADEVAWELLRDEWELLLAIGSGPTDAGTAAARIREPARAVGSRLQTLVEHGLVRCVDGGFGLVPALHKRQEGMSSYLRDLVLSRIDLAGPPPLGARVRYGLGGEAELRDFVEAASATALPDVVATASQPESEHSERFLAIFAVTSACPAPCPSDKRAGALSADILRVLRATALERSAKCADTSSKLWVAEMRVDPRVAVEIADRLDEFVVNAPGAEGTSATAFAVWPVSQPASNHHLSEDFES